MPLKPMYYKGLKLGYYWVGVIKLKTTILITATLLVLVSIVVNQRANLFIYLMTSSELPELLEPKDEGEEVTGF